MTVSGVALAVHELKVSWSRTDTAAGWFLLDHSLLDGPDLLPPAQQLIPGFYGANDDVSAYLVEASWTRGRSSDFSSVEQGQWTGTLRDPDGRFNPANPASPLYGLTDEPGRPIRHRAYFDGVWYPQFFGWTSSVEYEPRGRRGYLHIAADDLFVRLDIPSVAIAALANTTTGAVIGKILDSIGWTDTAYRVLAAGDKINTWPGLTASQDTLLSAIGNLLAVEFGLFFADAAGRAVFQSRRDRVTRPVAATISQEMKAIAPGVDLSKLVNQATYTKEGSTAQTYTDADSADPIFGLGPRPANEVTSPVLNSDQDAHDRAVYRVKASGGAMGNLWALTIDNRTAALLGNVLGLEVGDRVQSDEATSGTVFDGFVERIERSVTGTPYTDTAVYVLSQRAFDYFRLDSSLMDSAAVLIL